MRALILISIGLAIICAQFPAYAASAVLVRTLVEETGLLGESLVKALWPSAKSSIRSLPSESATIGMTESIVERSVPHLMRINAKGTPEWSTRKILVTKDFYKSFLESDSKDLSLKISWPEVTHTLLLRAEHNNDILGWDSLAEYRRRAKELLAARPEFAKSPEHSADALFTLYEKQLKKTTSTIKSVSSVARHFYNRWNNYDADTLITKAESIGYLLEAELLDIGAVTPSGAPAVPFAGWDEVSKLGFMLNRLSLISTIDMTRLESLGRQLEPFEAELAKASQLWRLGSSWEPVDLAAYDTVLENGISGSTLGKRLRVHMVAYNKEVERNKCRATEETLKTSLNDIIILNLLPRNQEEVSGWENYSSGDKDAFVEWGQRIQNIVKHRSLAVISNLTSSEAIQSQIRAETARRKVLVILGEASDKAHLRMPGSGTINVADLRLSFGSRVRVVGLFCGSHEALLPVPGLAVSGELRGAQAFGLFKGLIKNFDDQQPATVAEFVNDSLIYASHRKRLLLVVGGVTVGIEELHRQSDKVPYITSSTNAASGAIRSSSSTGYPKR